MKTKWGNRQEGEREKKRLPFIVVHVLLFSL